MEELEEIEMLGQQLVDGGDFLQMAVRFIFNTIVVWLMIHVFYFPKSKRRDYYFTFMLISISIFFLIYLLGGVKIKVGFALGLFAIFGILRYRTESMPVREMTYLFSIISMSVINALAQDISYMELLVVNAIFICAVWLFESYFLLKHISTKLVQYDRIALITPDKRQELIEDLKKRTGLDIVKVDIGGIDFLKDMAMIKIYYESSYEDAFNSINNQNKISKEQWTEV